MKLRLLLPLLAMLPTTALTAQEEIDPGTITVEGPEPPAATAEPPMVVEVMPEFPGGQEALFAYVIKKMYYPEQARENGIQGRVYVTFIVETDGSISTVKVLRGIGGGCDEEAVRVIQGMPQWTPGMQRGEAVRVRMNLPVMFKLH